MTIKNVALHFVGFLRVYTFLMIWVLLFYIVWWDLLVPFLVDCSQCRAVGKGRVFPVGIGLGDSRRSYLTLYVYEYLTLSLQQ